MCHVAKCVTSVTQWFVACCGAGKQMRYDGGGAHSFAVLHGRWVGVWFVLDDDESEWILCCPCVCRRQTIPRTTLSLLAQLLPRMDLPRYRLIRHFSCSCRCRCRLWLSWIHSRHRIPLRWLRAPPPRLVYPALPLVVQGHYRRRRRFLHVVYDVVSQSGVVGACASCCDK